MMESVTVSVLRFFACALMVMAFVPHHHADSASGRVDKPCSLCLSAQSSAASLAAEAPTLSPLAGEFLAPAAAIHAPGSAASVLLADPRAPPC